MQISIKIVCLFVTMSIVLEVTRHAKFYFNRVILSTKSSKVKKIGICNNILCFVITEIDKEILKWLYF